MSNKVHNIYLRNYTTTDDEFLQLQFGANKTSQVNLANNKRMFIIWKVVDGSNTFYCWKNFCNSSGSTATFAFSVFASECPDSSYPLRYVIVDDPNQNNTSITFTDESDNVLFDDFGVVCSGSLGQNYNRVPAAVLDFDEYF